VDGEGFTPGKEIQYPLYSRLDGPRGQCERIRKTSSPWEFETGIIKPVATMLSRPPQIRDKIKHKRKQAYEEKMKRKKGRMNKEYRERKKIYQLQ